MKISVWNNWSVTAVRSLVTRALFYTGIHSIHKSYPHFMPEDETMRRIYKTGSAVIAALLLILALFLCVGDWGASVGASLARNWLQELSTDITFDSLTGNLLQGYRLSGLKVSDIGGNEVVVLPELSVNLASLSLTPFGLVVDLEAQGLRLHESKLPSLLQDLQRDFPPTEEEKPDSELSRPLVMPRQLKLVDFASTEQPWVLETVSLTPQDVKDHYGLSLQARWNQLPLTVQGTVVADVKEPALNVVVGLLDATLSLEGALSRGFNIDADSLNLEKLVDALPDLASVEPGGRLSLEAQLRPEGPAWSVAGSASVADLAALGSLWGTVTVPFSFAGQELSIQGLTGNLFGASVSGDGNFNLESQMVKALFELGKVKLAGLPVQYVPSGVGAGLEHLSVDLSGPLTALNGKAQWKGGYANWSGLSVSALAGTVELKEGNFNAQASGAALKGAFSAKAKGAAQAHGPLSATFDWKNAHLAGLSTLLPEAKLAGLLSVNLKAGGTMANPTALLSLKGQSLSALNVAVPSLQAKAQASMDKITLERLNARVLGGALSASGAVTSWRDGKPDGTGKLRLSGLNLKALKKAVPSLPLTELSSKNDFQVSLRLVDGVALADASATVPSATAASVTLDSFVAKTHWNGQELRIKEGGVKLLGGSASLTGTVKPGKDVAELNLRGSLEKLDLKKASPTGVSGFVDGSLAVTGPLMAPKIDLSLVSEAVVYSRLVVSDLLLRVVGQGRYDVQLKAQGPKGPLLSGGGTVELPHGESEGAVNLNFKVSDLDIKALAPSPSPLGGLLWASVAAQGTPSAPDVSFRLWADELTTTALALQKPEVTGRFHGKKVDLLASLDIGDSRPQTKALLTLNDPWKLEFRAQGDRVNLHAVIPDQKELLKGRVSWQASGKVDGSGITADGKVFSDRIDVSKLKLTALSLPFRIRGMELEMDAGRGSFVDAPLLLTAQGNLAKQAYTGTLDLMGLDLHKVTEPFGIPGKVTGTAELHVKGEARVGTTLLADVKGSIRAENLEVANVPYMKVITSGAPLKVQKALITFSANPDEVTIMPGSTISFWPDDTVFRYVALSGPVWRQLPEARPEVPQELLKELQDQMRLSINGNINIKALNSMIGGLGVLVQSGVSGNTDPRELAGDFISGLLGNAKDQFRDVAFVVCGTYENPSICDLEVESNISFKEPDSWTDGGGKMSNQKSDAKSYKLQFRIPVGPGVGRGKSVGEQATGQILKQIINSLLSAGE